MPRPGLIVIDGPDAVGKTTLAKHLLDGDESGYINLTYDPVWKNTRPLFRLQYFSLIKAAVRLDQSKLTVIDRHWISEQIYGRTYRGGTNLNAECRMWDRVVQRMGGVYIICAPNVGSVVLRHGRSSRRRKEMFPLSPKVAEVADRYRRLWHGDPSEDDPFDYASTIMRAGGMRVREDSMFYDIDLDGDNLRAVSARAFGMLDERLLSQYRPSLSYRNGNYLGHPQRARLLFVGERINPNKSGKWPFVDHGASSAALSAVLQDMDFDERDALWTNAYANDEHVITLLEWYSHLKVVAFGEAASSYLSSNQIEHTKVLHPSFAKRFNQMGTFCRQLKEAIQ